MCCQLPTTPSCLILWALPQYSYSNFPVAVFTPVSIGCPKNNHHHLYRCCNWNTYNCYPLLKMSAKLIPPNFTCLPPWLSSLPLPWLHPVLPLTPVALRSIPLTATTTFYPILCIRLLLCDTFNAGYSVLSARHFFVSVLTCNKPQNSGRGKSVVTVPVTELRKLPSLHTRGLSWQPTVRRTRALQDGKTRWIDAPVRWRSKPVIHREEASKLLQETPYCPLMTSTCCVADLALVFMWSRGVCLVNRQSDSFCTFAT